MHHKQGLTALLLFCRSLYTQGQKRGQQTEPGQMTLAHQHNLYYLRPWEADNTVKAVIGSVSEQEWLNSELDFCPQRHFPADSPFIPCRGLWRPFRVE